LCHPNQPGNGPRDLPLALPPEYAEAYRRGFERAYRQPDSDEEPLTQAPAPAREYVGPTARRPPGHRAERTSSERSPWLVPVILVVLVLVLLGGAYGFGTLLSTSVGDTDVSVAVPDGVDIGEADDTGADRADGATRTPRPAKSGSRSPSTR